MLEIPSVIKGKREVAIHDPRHDMEALITEYLGQGARKVFLWLLDHNEDTDDRVIPETYRSLLISAVMAFKDAMEKPVISRDRLLNVAEVIREVCDHAE